MELSEVQLALIKRTKILIVDDLPENLQMLGNILREQGFQIAFATNGMQAIKIASTKNPNLVLLDISMPEMDGLAVFRKLKEMPETKDIPVIFLTAKTDSESIMKALSMGAVDYVAKPFDASDLLVRILQHLSISKTTDAETEEEKTIILSKTIKVLESEYMPKYKDIRTGMFIDDILQFANSIAELGSQNKIKGLVEYGTLLQENAEGLKIARMTAVLEQFPAIINKIATRSNGYTVKGE